MGILKSLDSFLSQLDSYIAQMNGKITCVQGKYLRKTKVFITSEFELAYR